METDVSGVSIGAKVLQAKKCINYGCDEVLDNATLHPIPLPAKTI